MHKRILLAGAVLVAVLATPGVALAQGVSPWLDAITVLEDAFTGPHCPRPLAHRHCGRRPHVCLW